MRAWLLLLVLPLVTVLACTRTEEPAPPPAATPGAGAPAIAGAATASPGAVATPARDEDEDDEDKDEDEVGGEFDLDADASSYTGWTPRLVQFVVKPLNGTPPYTFTWDFGDGSPSATGELVRHTFTKVGRIDVFVNGEDAKGEKAQVQLVLFLQTPEEYAKRMGIDPALLMETPSPAAATSPAAEGGGAGASPAPAAEAAP